MFKILPLPGTIRSVREHEQSAGLYAAPRGQFSRFHTPLSVYCSYLVGAPETGLRAQPVDRK